MKVLVVKLSSLGDVVHTFPAVTDAMRSVPGLVLDWAVEEAFAPLVHMHPAVRRAIPVPLRRLRKAPRAAMGNGEAATIRAALHAEAYDVVIDAQGLMKSAVVGLFARGRRHGFARGSARESLATLAYHTAHAVPEVEHMASRIRKLFAASLGYNLTGLVADAGLKVLAEPRPAQPYIVMLHGTTWRTKTWPVKHWRDLALHAAERGLEARIFAQGAQESARAAAIAEDLPSVSIIPPGPIPDLVPVIANAEAVVSVDSGLGHLAAALAVPTVGLYGPTNPRLTGLFGPKALELKSLRPCAPCERAHCRIAPDLVEGPPCLTDFSARDVWRALNVLRFGHADAMDKGTATMAHEGRSSPAQ
ncbi:lipopolysaccharide heptosyltransferase I [Xanthobacter sp. DSM 24535]|uniref:lipopolysaccharide heptosyltransferase I n=1 Tax=Roseixanthobacter psychrophilus TaxID=3119917 RepID=UPI003728C2DB